ncbi:S8 family serine peptidase [Solirubrobacter soli]|uniref:S8 family serine peptidase n=1 Tax=Solirubrobacter soli TaxID=363832 RepID=UPI000400D7A2|nr:S8 family serine peptidase [Solirubrobacter soli]
MGRILAVLATFMLFVSPARADPQPAEEQWAASPQTVLDLPGAWQLSQGKGVVVAVLDSGVRLSHPDLRGNLWTNPAEIPGNHRDDDGNGYVDDVHGVDLTGEHSLNDAQGHGTHVSGTIAAARNGKGVVGVAYNAKLMVVRVLDERGSGTTKALAEGIRYAAANGARIINISLETTADDPRIRAAVKAASAANVLIVCSAGNMGANIDRRPLFPVSIPADNLVGVAATAPADGGEAITQFSNFGPLTVPVAAPGDGVVSTANDGGYESRSGTSMAAPHVAGVAALMASVAPNLSAQELRGELLEHAVKPPTPGKPGYVDALGSVQAAMAAADLAGRAGIGARPEVRILGSSRRGRVIRAQLAKSENVRFIRVRLDGKVVSVLNGTRTPQTLILRNFKGRTLLAEGLGPNGGRIASATAPVGGASPAPDVIALSGSSTAGAEVAEVLRNRPHATDFQLVSGGTEMGLADAARGIVDAGLVDRPLTTSDPPGLVFTPFAGSSTVGFVTRGAPPEELGRILRWIAASATP